MNDEDVCECPECGFIGTADDFDAGGADDGMCFCNNCWREVKLIEICKEKSE